MSAYDAVQSGGLKLKGLSDNGIKKKKKKKSKDKEKERKHLELSLTQEENEPTSPTSPTGSASRMPYVPRKTKAELAFEKVKEKRQAELILKKAKTTHKEQIMDLNKHLDSLTEHFDIPKVSWTK